MTRFHSGTTKRCSGNRFSGGCSEVAPHSVHIKKVDGIVMLIPKGAEWDLFERSLEGFSEDYMAAPRSQGTADVRESLD